MNTLNLPCLDIYYSLPFLITCVVGVSRVNFPGDAAVDWRFDRRTANASRDKIEWAGKTWDDDGRRVADGTGLRPFGRGIGGTALGGGMMG